MKLKSCYLCRSITKPRWATKKEQQRNRRSNRMLTYNAVTLSMAEWADRIGMKYVVLKSRIQIGWTVERALTKSLERSPPCRDAKGLFVPAGLPPLPASEELTTGGRQ